MRISKRSIIRRIFPAVGLAVALATLLLARPGQAGAGESDGPAAVGNPASGIIYIYTAFDSNMLMYLTAIQNGAAVAYCASTVPQILPHPHARLDGTYAVGFQTGHPNDYRWEKSSLTWLGWEIYKLIGLGGGTTVLSCLVLRPVGTDTIQFPGQDPAIRFG